ncbi:MAG TPA: ATPase, T2SS/T4P/T4SS family [Acidimicrobiales bacterium]|nr:ATPase, T2SS/T4P/T4SS family [Acidimicrobiales bacterium]
MTSGVGDVVGRVQARLVDRGAGRPGNVEAAQVAELVRDEAPLLPAAAVEAAVATVVAAVAGLGPLEPLLADPAVSDVCVNGGGAVWVERRGRLERTGLVLEPAEVGRLIERIVAPLGLRADRSSPSVDARLPDGSRVHAVVPPLAVDGPCLTIRRFAATAVPLSSFCPSDDVAALLRTAVLRGLNVVVAGGTGAGKTTLLNALAAEIPAGQRILTVEDAAELRLPQEHVVRLESRPANAEGAGHVSVRELVRNALRMRPDRIIVGECRGGEALDMLQAMNTGHDGSMTTCHANSCADALRRLETMVLLADVGLPLVAVREQLASAVDLVVQVVRVAGADGRRKVVAVAEVVEEGADAGRVRTLAAADGVVTTEPSVPRWRR